MLDELEFDILLDEKVFNERWVIGYYDKLEKAERVVKDNICDINDGGVYDYALIEKIKKNSLHPRATDNDNKEVYYFKFNCDKKRFERCNNPKNKEDSNE